MAMAHLPWASASSWLASRSHHGRSHKDEQKDTRETDVETDRRADTPTHTPSRFLPVMHLAALRGAEREAPK